ncbi:MAG: MerR family transcriptional regulator [Bryobacteraceae bacterium]|jgi:hypothetical protein
MKARYPIKCPGARANAGKVKRSSVGTKLAGTIAACKSATTAKTGCIADRKALAGAAVEQAGRNRRGEGLDTGPFSQRPLSAKSGDSIGKSAGLSTRVTKARQTTTCIRETYSIGDLAQVFGVHHERVESWVGRGLLGRTRAIGADRGDTRFAEADVARFVRGNPREYDLRRVDQMWFKAMVFASLAGCGMRAGYGRKDGD